MVDGSYRLVREACDRLHLRNAMHCFWEAPGVVFNADCVSAVRKAVEITGVDAMDIVSGAGHDACNVSSVAPTSMIFIPCEGGLSHNEAEAAAPMHVSCGGNILLHAILECAGNAGIRR
jgi:N-carbamoyl-L-amino-acid hydrolase